jgi:release factor glutamine methyltransferase
MNTIQDIFRKGRALLHGVANSAVEAKVLLLLATGMSEAEFLASPGMPLSKGKERRFLRLIERRLSGVPLAYITGKKEFWSQTFKVGPGVFIPRPETELIVEKVLELGEGGEETIADIGTGSGNIAVALAKELPRAHIIATDLSAKALKIAQFNAKMSQVENITFVAGNLFAPLIRLNLEQKCDFIVSNPPYVAAGDWEGLAGEVRNCEPRRALVAGKGGLEFIRRLVNGAPAYLKPGGYLVFEIGEGQADAALALFDDRWVNPQAAVDLRGIPRVAIARYYYGLGLRLSRRNH